MHSAAHRRKQGLHRHGTSVDRALGRRQPTGEDAGRYTSQRLYSYKYLVSLFEQTQLLPAVFPSCVLVSF